VRLSPRTGTEDVTMTKTRYVSACVALGVMLALVMLGLWRWQDSRLASTLAERHLAASQAAQRLVEGQRASNLASRAELLVGNQAFVGYMAQALGGALPGESVDTASIVDLLDERRAQFGLAVAAVLDGQGHLVVATERFTQRRELGEEPLFLRARKSFMPTTGLWPDGDRLLHVAILPLSVDGSSDGFLLIGENVDQPIAQAVADVADVDAALFAATTSGSVVLGSTLGAASEKALATALSSVAKGATVRSDVVLDGRRYRIASAPLFGSSNGRLLSLVAHDRVASALRSLWLPWLIGGIALLALLAAMATWMWTQMLQPAHVLSGLVERAGSGDYHLKMAEHGAPPMVGLAAAFNRLMQRLQAG